MIKVVFVCTGNTCRSPMARAIFKEKMKERGLTGKDFVVSSAGIMADENLKTNPHTITVLKSNGISAKPEKAKQLNKRLVNKNTVLIAMTDAHKQWIKNLPNSYSLSDFVPGVNLPDPAGYDVDEYEKTYVVLNRVLEVVLDKLTEMKL